MRDEVLAELSRFLKTQNTKRKSRFAVFDRPIVIMLIGTLLLTFITTYWSTLQHRLDLKFELINTLPTAYQKTGNLLNHWLEHVLWIAEERSQPRAKQDAKALESWERQVSALEQEYIKTEPPLDGVLTKVEALYGQDKVRSTAKAMKTKIIELENLLQATNRAYNPTRSLPIEKIKEIRTQRKELVSELNALKDELLVEMAKELNGFAWAISR